MILIPKTIHYIWLGGKPMPPLMCQWREKWGTLHPDWKIRIWSEAPDHIERLVCNSRMLASQYPFLLRRCCHLSQRSNIWRYELIERFGGLYLDTDFEPVRNIEDLIDSREAFAGKSTVTYPEGTKIEAACSLIGCIPHHPWTRDLVECVKTRDPAVSRSLGFSYFHEITSRHPEVALFEPDVFYSQRWEQPGRYKPPLSKDAYAVHRWSSKWFPDGFKPLKTS